MAPGRKIIQFIELLSQIFEFPVRAENDPGPSGISSLFSFFSSRIFVIPRYFFKKGKIARVGIRNAATQWKLFSRR
jgi:hypothetical protein